MKNSSTTNSLLNRIEIIANLGSYETDLVKGTWTCSDNFVTIFGLEKKQLYKQEEFKKIVHPDDVEDVLKYFKTCLSEKKDFNYHYRCIRPDGKVISVISKSEVYYNNEGVPLKIIGIKQDVTEHELNKINAQINDFLSLVAHDLKSPISQIEMLSSMIEDKLFLDNEALELLKLQQQSCKLSQNIILEILNMLDAERDYEMNTNNFNISKIVKESIQQFTNSANEKNIIIKTTIEDDVFLKINDLQITRLLDNLLSNAIKYTLPEKNIFVSLLKTETVVTLIIKDEGIGIPKKIMPFLFDKFSYKKRRKGTQGEQSTGLGLNIIKQIVDLHHAKISIESEENEGSSFIITFPLELEQNTLK